MKIRTAISAGVLASGAIAGSASAGDIILDGLGGPAVMSSKDIADYTFGGSEVGNFSTESLINLNDDINRFGISTEGLITFVLADVDTDGDGLQDSLGFIVLFDDTNHPNQPFQGEGGADPTSISMMSSANSSNTAWINGAADAIQQVSLGGLQAAMGPMGWDANNSGTGFAWSELEAGDFFTFNFSQADDPGTIEGFQFLSWDGEGWGQIATGEWTAADQFAFSFTVLPLPTAAWAGLIGLGAAAGVRRRRMAKRDQD